MKQIPKFTGRIINTYGVEDTSAEPEWFSNVDLCRSHQYL